MITSTSNTGSSASFQDVQALWVAAFGNDLQLVKHPEQPKMSPIVTSPLDFGQYLLTDLGMVTEAQLWDAFAGQNLALASFCMDARMARDTYDWLLSRSKGQVLVPLFIAAGICQTGSEERQEALTATLDWFCQNFNISKIWAGGHSHNCGGLAHIHHTRSVCTKLDCNAGSRAEKNFVRNEIRAGVNQAIRNTHYGRTQKVLVSLRAKGRVTFEPFR